MLVFLDTEFTDFSDSQLISIGLVSEDGQHELYLEVQDFDRAICNSFVQAEVWRHLGLLPNAITREADIQTRLRAWFATLPRSVTLACDSQHDRDLLADTFEGEWPVNFVGWLDLRPMIDSGIFDKAVAAYHSKDSPWHHALYDARAHRAGWLAWMDANKTWKRCSTGA
ncbi:3'-5' exoribonuclease [Amantichitinum ursilacus]|uniref:3'-5' exoribonuclease n=1 Tax=Amantichitinum ursilacus TaxID=857265 RepID=UPI0006B62C50|nr:3'-5' exoribonuclease [Amantichitinum ursilacus]